ncbi:MAG TPA: Mur ligase family protein [Thermomicrobiales bacterium]|nr:Mur ligase family protein [Thermomicrobiales bacterium]
MDAVELRTLDGPNLFLLRPAIKLELRASDEERSALDPEILGLVRERVDVPQDASGRIDIAKQLAGVVAWLHAELDMGLAEIVVRELEEEGHAAVAFSWDRRRASKVLGHLAWRLVAGEAADLEAELGEIRALLTAEPDASDLPEMWPDSKRTVPTIGITGTNGKTTTTRLVASILRHAGNKVGWSSSSGVLIDGEMVLSGDYTGPSGAARVFEEPGIDYAVVETARGGILLRGLGYEHNDVSVMTNISADHMGLHGVYSLDVLGEVKAVVARVTREDGFAVLNADDLRVLRVRDVIVARPFLFTRNPEHADVRRHVGVGGWALVVENNAIVWYHDGEHEVLAELDAVPVTFGGRAQHMVENALAAAAACLGVRLSAEQVREGLAAFHNRPDQNRGRLNVYEVDGATVVVDFAHNEAGLEHLLAFARGFCDSSGKLYAVIGTAGDRDEAAITGIARIAATRADRVIIKDSERYLRGREAGEMLDLMRPVVGEVLVDETGNEREGFFSGLRRLEPGDVLAVMCVEDYETILPYLDERATSLS